MQACPESPFPKRQKLRLGRRFCRGVEDAVDRVGVADARP
jgi:hypothetical protein